MRYPFSTIVIIYNPKSTGESKKNAHELRKVLRAELSKKVRVSLKATTHAGHAEKIGAQYAKKDEAVLLVSSSGDGGYNELINGVLSHKTSNVATCVLPSGNANDHHHATKNDDVISRIVAGKTTKIDVLQIEAIINGKPWKHYAHSYAGIGLTASVGKKLTEATLNPINEKFLTIRYLLTFRHVTVKLSTHRRRHQYSSVVFGNIDRMSKIIKLSQEAKLDDGKFEIYETRYRSVLRILAVLLIGSTIGLKPTIRTDRISFNAKKPLELQFDGEVVKLDGHNDVTIIVEKRRLHIVY